MLRMTPSLHNAPQLARNGVMALMLACASLSAKALTLGHFSVESGLGEPLRAAIEITQYKVEDLRKLKVQLAEPASFEQSGMTFHPALNGLQVRLEFRGDGKPYIAFSGQRPVNDHFIDVIVEAQWPSGLLAMNYTLLISPVGAMKALVENSDGNDAVIAPVASPQVLPPVVALVAGDENTDTEETLTVVAGDTASRLVLRQMPAGVTLDQMLLAMVRANPEAFIEGNVNLLREGAQVQLPSAQDAALISAKEARQTVVAQNVDFVAYARRLAQSALKAPENATREMSGTVSSNTPTSAPQLPAQDTLTLSKRELGSDSAEARLADEREIQDKTEQLAALQKNLETLKSLSATTMPSAAEKPDASVAPAPQSTAPTLPLAVAETAPTSSLVDQVSRSSSIWAWVLALLSSMLAWVWLARRRPAKGSDLFDQPKHPAAQREPSFSELAPQAEDAMPERAPLPPSLPPQFADLDLNLTPAPSTQPTAAAAQPADPKP